MDQPIINLQLSLMDTVWIAYYIATSVCGEYIDYLTWVAN